MNIPVAFMHRFSSKRFFSTTFQKTWPWAVLGVFLFILLNMYRLRVALPLAGLHMEDVYYFNNYYDHGVPFSAILEKHGGQPYLILWTNFFAWLIATCDIRIQPYLYQWTGFFWATVAVSLPFFSGMIRSKAIAVTGPLVLGMIGLNHAFYSITLIYTMYTGVVAALCFLFYDSPKTPAGMILLILSMVIFPWFGPYSVLIIPAGILLFILFPEDKKKLLLILTALCSTGIYYLLGVEQGTSNILQLKQLWIIQTYLHILLEDIVLLGQVGKISLYYLYPVLLLLGIVFYVLRHDHQYLRYSMVLILLITISLLLIFASDRYALTLYVRPCHKMISIFFWVLFLLFTIDRLSMTANDSRSVIICFMISSALLVYFDNTKHPEKSVVRFVEHQKAFLTAIHYYEGFQLKKRNQYIVLKLKDHPDSFWKPRVEIGSRMAGKREIGKEDLPRPLVGEEFIVDSRGQ